MKRGRLLVAAGAGEVDHVVAAFLVLSGRKSPEVGTPEARVWRSPRSTGASPATRPAVAVGVRTRSRSRDSCRDGRGLARDGTIERLSGNPLARRFIRRQRLRMPGCADLSDDDLGALWAYANWLGTTRGGLDAPSAAF